MGGKKSSSFSLCGMLKSCFSSGNKDCEYYYEENSRRIFASDEDRGRWVAEPGIDNKASAFIANFYANRVTHQFAN
ncbi:hypothetical protein Lal_00050010 [Lupinus albus]|uniref:Uncharacterized protein n=1 Tax=Lupinus albus TaxID=3870 RepID=A0A6A5LZ95_LUPAL|nr:hypothetical protein Lalb_Chr12g0200511 [Lupinus albus]KAF1867581.1 hypothetical protein Lal_00050010 [Lupinus albus]